jgi:HNH endonuclease
MAERIGSELRRLIAARANYLCEYCLVAEEDTYFGCEVDHIISVKHGGVTEAENLAYACAFCNRHKGSDIASISQHTGSLVRFYNPRIDRWADHFELDGLYIKSVSEIGEVTARILRFNDSEQILEREALSAIGRYPNALAKLQIET